MACFNSGELCPKKNCVHTQVASTTPLTVDMLTWTTMARSAQKVRSYAPPCPQKNVLLDGPFTSWQQKKNRAQVFFVVPNVENVSQKKHTQTHLYPAWASGHTKRSKSPCVTSHCLAIGKGLALSFEWLFNSNEGRSESKLVQAPIRCMRRKRGGFTKYHHPSSKKNLPLRIKRIEESSFNGTSSRFLRMKKKVWNHLLKSF